MNIQNCMNPTSCLKEMIQSIERWAKVGMDSKFLLCVIASLIVVSYSVDDIFVEASDDRPDAYLKWLEDSYTSPGTGVVRVVDHFMNQDSEKAENLTVYVYTEETEDDGGITITVTETGPDTGIFEGAVFFSETEESSGNRLHVADGDLIGAEYTYSTVPGSDSLEDMIGVGQDIMIKNSLDIADSYGVMPTVSLDRTVYPVPFGGINDFEDIIENYPVDESLFPVHLTATKGNALDASTTLSTGDLVLHIRISDANFDISSQDVDKISQDLAGTTVGPLKISIYRDSQTMVLAYAGGSTPNENGLIDVGDDNPDTARQLGPIFEVAPEAGIFELDFVVRYTDGLTDSKCPATAVFTSLNDDVVSGSEESRFDLPSIEKENYCIMNGDVLYVDYTFIDESGKVYHIQDNAMFDLRNGVLESDRPVYIIGSYMILTLTDLDLDLDNDAAETYTLDLIEWDSYTATLAMGELGGERTAFDPEPSDFRETGDSTGIFQIVITIPKSLGGENLERGEEIVLEYTDWGPTDADYVGSEDEDINLTIFTSNFGATVELDQKIYTWTDKVYITIVSPNHNFDSDLVEEIGNTDEYPVKIATRQFSLDNYKLVETGNDTGIFTGEIILTGFTHDADGNPRTGVDGNDVVDINPSGKGPTDGFLPSSSDDGVTIAFEFSEDETVVGSALIQWNEGQVEWLEADYPSTGTAVVRVIDPDMNWNPEAVDNFDVYVWSDSDLIGTDPTVSETGAATGIFEGTVFFTTTDESSGHRLRVMVGDTLYSKYEDNTLPSPYALADELDITDTSMIRINIPPLKQIWFGIAPSDVQCKSGMELILKHSGEPVCVKPETKQKLIERGW